MSRSGSARGTAGRVGTWLAATAVLASAGAGFTVGVSRSQSPPGGAPTGAFVASLEHSIEGAIEQISATMADHQLRRRGVTVLGSNASLRGVPFESLRLRLAASSRPSAAEAGQGVFTGQALLEYQLEVDDVRVGRRADARFRLRDGGWRLVRVAPSGLDLWDHEPVQSVRNGDVLVLGRQGDARLRALSVTAESARDDVDEFWTVAWPGTAVVVLPSDSDLLNPLLGVRSRGEDQVAVTRWEAGPDGPVIRVIVNPTYYDQMSPLAREIVLRHEITHVAQDALPRGGVPTWLTEGLAEYVGYRGSGVPRTLVGAQLFAQVRAGDLPRRLPDDSDFGFGRGSSERRVAYEAGWTFHQMLADRFGEGTLVPFYAEVARGRGSTQERLDDAAEEVFGTSFDQLEADWRSWLEDNA